jgi:glycosyltransferase involved in cell wall biosynthesis
MTKIYNGVDIIEQRLKIGFLASSFANRYGSGTAKHFEIVSKLLCNNFKSEVEVTFFCNSKEQYLYLKKDPDFFNAKLILLPSVKGKWLKSSRQYFKYAFNLRQYKIDILHFSVPRLYPFFWLFPARKFVCTFHAGGEITAEKDRFILSREIYNLTAKTFFQKLDAIIAVSEYGKNEISDSYRIPKKLITVMHGGTDDIWKVRSKAPKNHLRNNRKLIVVVGRWQKYKNIQVVAKALAEAKQMELKKFHFVFVGKKISSNSIIIEQHLSKVDNKFYDTIDYLEDESYVGLIKEADLVIVPSLNEGFSHPIFDAFSLGSRVLIHDNSPAAQILAHRKGVFIADLRNSGDLIDFINNAIRMPKSNLIENRDFLESIEATWGQLAKNYVKLYNKLIK